MINLPPPPDPNDTRAFRDWCYRVYRALMQLSGSDAAFPDAMASVSAARSTEALELAHGAQLAAMAQTVAQLQREIESLQLAAAPRQTRDTAQDAILYAGSQR